MALLLVVRGLQDGCTVPHHVHAREHLVLGWGGEAPVGVLGDTPGVGDRRAPRAWLQLVEDGLAAGLPREDAAAVRPDQDERLGRTTVEPARPGDGLAQRLGGSRLDDDRHAGQHVLEDVPGSDAPAREHPAGDVVQDAAHQLLRQPRDEQLRVPGPVSEPQRVGEGGTVVVVVEPRRVLRVVLGVLAPAAVRHTDHLPAVLEDRVDGVLVDLVVGRVRPAHVAVAAVARRQRTHPGRVLRVSWHPASFVLAAMLPSGTDSPGASSTACACRRAVRAHRVRPD